MKSDNISASKYTESNPRTVICTSDDNGLNQGNIHFKFSDNSIYSFDLTTISCINPMYFSSFNSTSDIEILLPKTVTYGHLMEFLFIFKNGFGEYENCSIENSKKLIFFLQISEFFLNEAFSVEFIKEIILNNLNTENAIHLLKFSYDKLSFSTSINVENDDIWFDLFYKTLEIIGKNVNSFLNNISLIKQFDNKVVNELIEKICSHLILGNFILIENTTINTTHPIDNINESNQSYEIEGENFFESMHFETKGNLKGNHKNDQSQNIHSVLNNNHLGKQNGLVLLNEKKEINFISMNDIENIISLLYEHKNCINFFDTITKEQMDLYSSESTKELKESPHPTFQVKIPYDFDNFYEEYSIDQVVNNKKIIFVIYYKQNEDSFNVSIKLSDNVNDLYNNSQIASNYLPNKCNNQQIIHSEEKYCFKILTFFSIVSINDEHSLINSSQTNIKSLSNKKSMNNIFTMNNFQSLIRSRVPNNSNGVKPIEQSNNNVMIDNNGLIQLIEDSSNDLFSFDSDSFFSLKIYLKLCFTHSVLASYFLQSFNKLCHEPKINKISKQLLLLMIKNKYLAKSSEDEVVIALLNWLNDEINIKEDITQLFDLIKWNVVSDDLIFELLIKYAHMIINEDLENIFIKAFNEKEIGIKKRKGKDFVVTKDLIGSFFIAAKRVNYHSVYNQMIKNSKLNLINNAILNKMGNKNKCNHDDNLDSDNEIKNSVDNKKIKMKSTSYLTSQLNNSQQWNGNKMVIKTNKHFSKSNTQNLINFFSKQNLRINNKDITHPQNTHKTISRFSKDKDNQAKKINTIPLNTSVNKEKSNHRSTTPNMINKCKEIKTVTSMKEVISKKDINTIVKQPEYEKNRSKHTTPIKNSDYLQCKYSLYVNSNHKPITKLVKYKSKGDLNATANNKNKANNKYKIGIELKKEIHGINLGIKDQ